VIEFIITGNIPSGNRKQIGYKNKKPFLFKQKQKEIKSIISQIKQQWRSTTINKKVKVEYLFYFPDKRRRDVDNRMKILNDCLEDAGVIADDSLIFEGKFKKIISKKKGHLTIIRIKEIKDEYISF